MFSKEEISTTKDHSCFPGPAIVEAVFLLD